MEESQSTTDYNISELASKLKASNSGKEQLEIIQTVVKGGNLDHVDLLLEAGKHAIISVDVINEALYFAVKAESKVVIEHLIGKGADVKGMIADALVLVAREGKCNLISYLLDKGADVNSINDGDETALMKAAQAGHQEAVDLLLRAGADVNVTEAYGENNTALISASYEGFDSCLALLLKAGADVNARNDRNLTALFAATMYGHDQCVELLIQAGADVNISDAIKPNGHWGNALMFAMDQGYNKCYEKCVDILLQAGADVNSTDGTFEAPLHKAAKRSLKCAVLLLRAGAHVNKENRDGFNALQCHLTESLFSRKMAALLLAAGESIDGTTGKIYSPRIGNFIRIPKYVQQLLATQKEFRLMSICREAIRIHLLSLNHVNLFARVPKLNLPSSLVEYILHNVSLDATDDDDDTDDDSDDESDEEESEREFWSS